MKSLPSIDPIATTIVALACAKNLVVRNALKALPNFVFPMVEEDDVPIQVVTEVQEISYFVLDMGEGSVVPRMDVRNPPLVDRGFVQLMVVDGVVRWMDVRSLHSRQRCIV